MNADSSPLPSTPALASATALPAVPGKRASHSSAPGSLSGAFLFRILLTALVSGLGTGPAAAAPTTLRFGFSRQIFDSINETDGRAALRLHAGEIGKSSELVMYLVDRPLASPAAIRQALETQAIDILAAPTDEYLALPRALTVGPLIVAIVAGRPDDEYVLVTRRDRDLRRLGDLRGRGIIVQRGVRMPLSRIWLDLLTLRENLGPADQFFSEVRVESKPSRTVLPVFFGQADSCLVSRKALQTMGDLNPQIAQQLVAISTSPPIVPSVMCFRAGVPAADINRVVEAVNNLHHTTSGRQITVIFQSERLATLSDDGLDSARALMAEHARLLSAPRPVARVAEERPAP